MTWIDLGNPKPRSLAITYDPYVWDVQLSAPLSIPEFLPDDSLTSVLERRRTLRTFGKISNDVLGHLLWVTSRQVSTGHCHFGFSLSQRPVPSGGAIHPVHILISNQEEKFWQRYDPLSHSLHKLSSACAESLLEVGDRILSIQSGELIMLVAEPGMTSAKYEDSNSIIWRDAGVILGNLALASELLNLAFCPLGVTGEPWASSISKQGLLKGVGMAVIGAR